ncbi:MAG: hypothetical protein HY851_10165, partial [candidate division Zixibacteria bacterium]|nr:hypothetical protein [candidate division Zixibacteria bacterium]
MLKQLAIVFVMLLLAGSVFGGSGTVTLKNGKEYKGVAYSVDTTDDVLIIEQGGWIQKILPERIERVIDSDGRDVTTEILAALRYQPSIESPTPATPEVKPAPQVTASTPLSDNSRQRYRRHRIGKPFDVAFGVRGNYTVPFGDYYEGFTSGLGFEGDLRIQVSDEMALMFLVSRSGMKVGEMPPLYPIWPYVLDRIDLSMSAMRYYVGLMQTGRTGSRRDTPDLWYVYFAIGAVAHRAKATIYAHDFNTLQPYIFVAEPTTDTRFGNLFGAGYII